MKPTAADVKREIQVAIDAAWEAAQTDPTVKAAWQRLFPDGKKPTQEEFIRCLAQEARARQST